MWGVKTNLGACKCFLHGFIVITVHGGGDDADEFQSCVPAKF